MFKWLRWRTTGEVLVIIIAGTVCFSVLAAGATIAIIEIVHPSSNTDLVVTKLGGVINTLIGLMAGFLAGRTDVAHAIPPRGETPPPKDDDPL